MEQVLGKGQKLNKADLLEELKKVGHEEDAAFSEYVCKGPVYDSYPKYRKEEGYFQRCWIWERPLDNEVLNVVMGDLGNGFCVFVCEATEEDMDKQLEMWKAADDPSFESEKCEEGEGASLVSCPKCELGELVMKSDN